MVTNLFRNNPFQNQVQVQAKQPLFINELILVTYALISNAVEYIYLQPRGKYVQCI